ncbi:hypothetical protein [Corynebacterium sp. H78]|uniref:hypothetical protein n=1 Tax=Corynebacterium sp. H78 TaxID=3133417 RepID=UPI0030A8E1FD
MSAAPTVVNKVFDVVGDGASVAFAPGSVDLLGEECAATGGMLLASAIPVYAAVGVEEIPEQELVVVVGREEHRMPYPDSVPEAYPPVVTAVIAAIIALQHSVHLVPRTSGGVKVTVVSTIPERRGLGELQAIQSALALALNARWGDRDDVPTRARFATAMHEVSLPHFGPQWALHPYTVSLRSRPDSVLCCNHSDDAVTQVERPQSLALLVAYSPDITGGSPQVDRQVFFDEACAAFGVETLHGLPEAQPRVLDWIRARHEVHPDDDVPTISRANQWLDEASGSSDRARAVSGHLRHADLAAVLSGVKRDIAERDSAPAEGSTLARLLEGAADDIVVRCVPAPGASMVVWCSPEEAGELATVITGNCGRVIAIEDTSAGAAVVDA